MLREAYLPVTLQMVRVDKRVRRNWKLVKLNSKKPRIQTTRNREQKKLHRSVLRRIMYLTNPNIAPPHQAPASTLASMHGQLLV